MINNVSSFSGGQPLSLSKAERAERLEKALDSHRVGLAELNPDQLAAKRSYGHQMVDDIAAARFTQPASGQSSEDFSVLQARLTAGA